MALKMVGRAVLCPPLARNKNGAHGLSRHSCATAEVTRPTSRNPNAAGGTGRANSSHDAWR